MTDDQTAPTPPEGPTPPKDPADEATAPAPRSRRRVLGAAGASLLAGGALGFAGGRQSHAAPEPPSPLTHRAHPLRGTHQQGITTPAQDYLFTAAFDVTSTSRDDLEQLMADWCAASEQMVAGELVGGAPLANPEAPPKDTGEAWGYPPSSLTITVGVGSTLFRDAGGRDRFGLAAREPAVLRDGMPRFANESLRAAQSDGDLVVQACADDAQVAVHAIRNLARIGMGTVAMRWTQTGQGRTSSTSTDQETPRNLFGFKDGTLNLKQEAGDAELSKHLWVGADDDQGAWLAGGTYLVVRKIRMFLETWDRLSLAEQQRIMGRDKRHGAALSVADPAAPHAEFTAPDYRASRDGELAIARDAHIRVVSPENNHGARMLRRGYNYTEGSTSLGQLNGGLFFQAFVRDPRAGFYDILHRMTRSDALTEYLQHVASGLFAVLPGVGSGDTMFGQRLFR